MSFWIFILIGFILAALSGAAKGLSDRINFHQSTLPKLLWNGFWLMHGDKSKGIEPSWKRKYKHMDPSLGEWFPGSTTVFVSITDGWHLCQMVYKWLLIAASIIIAYNVPQAVKTLNMSIPVIISGIITWVLVYIFIQIGFKVSYK